MIATKKHALEIAQEVKKGLETIYGPRLKGVYLYGSAARDELNENSDIDIAVILDKINNRYLEHKRISQLGADVSLQNDTVVLFLFATQEELETGRIAIFRNIRREGILA